MPEDLKRVGDAVSQLEERSKHIQRVSAGIRANISHIKMMIEEARKKAASVTYLCQQF